MGYRIKEIYDQDIITLEEVKNFLRIDNDEDNNLLNKLTQSAIETAEIHSGLLLRKHIIEEYFTSNYSSDTKFELSLTKKPCKSVIEVVCDGVKIEDSEFKLENNHITIKKKGHNFQVNYLAGLDKFEVSASVRIGILMHVSNMYDKRDGDNILPQNIVALYRQFRFIRI